MIKLTLDTNCIIDLEDKRDSAPSLRKLIEHHENGDIDLAVVVVSAYENQPNRYYTQNYREFQDRLEKVGLANATQLHSILYFNISFLDKSLLCDKKLLRLEEEIHETLFPNLPFSLDDARNAGISDRKWKNAFCDRQMLWAHLYEERDIFVTGDENFKKRLKRSHTFRACKIQTPDEAVISVF